MAETVNLMTASGTGADRASGVAAYPQVTTTKLDLHPIACASGDSLMVRACSLHGRPCGVIFTE